MKLIILIVASLTWGCVTTEPQISDEQALAIAPEFPDGKYVHDVTIDAPGHGHWQMRGVLRMSPSGITMLGLSPMGTTVFSIEDRFGSENAKIEVFQDELKPHADKILEFYSQLRPHLKHRKIDRQAEVPAGWDIKFFASKKVPPLPPTIQISSKRFSLRIEVDQYEL